MEPTTRASAKRKLFPVDPSNDVDVGKHRKRHLKGEQKNPNEGDGRRIALMTAPTAPSQSSSFIMQSKGKNAHLKGRKRFVADLEDMKVASTQGLTVHGLSVQRLRSGDEEGTIEFTVVQDDQSPIVDVTLLAPDTADYPENHIFYAFSSNSDTRPAVLDVIQDLSNQRARIIQDTVRRLLFDLARTTDPYLQDSQMQDEYTDEDESEDSTYYDDYMDLTFGSSISKLAHFDIKRLEHDFLQAIADDYRPGLIRFGMDEFVLSVSLPIVSLAKRVSPRVLMAWDRRLLARTQHLTLIISGLRGIYPVLKPDGTYRDDAVAKCAALSFKVGLTQKYKPSRDHTADLVRNFPLSVPKQDNIHENVDGVMPQELEAASYDLEDPSYDEIQQSTAGDERRENDTGSFERFSLSASLESLLDRRFMRVVQLRIKFKLGWAGAEALFAELETSQRPVDEIFPGLTKLLRAADRGEQTLAKSYVLPFDPLKDRDENEPLNLPQLAFSYLLRRLMLCTRFCLVCHNATSSEYEVIKPYVCDSKLCAYQYYNLNLGLSLEYEICHNTQTVDLLVSLAYSAASGGVLDEPLPIGLGLRVPLPAAGQGLQLPQHLSTPMDSSTPAVQVPASGDGLWDFDTLDIGRMRAAIVLLIDTLPSISDMKRHLEKKRSKLTGMNPTILPAAWSVLRWCIGSCTAHLEELQRPEDKVQNIDMSLRQFRFSVGAPDAEAKFKCAVAEAQKVNKNALKYPSLFAFHGSPLKNWHSIIRHGLWFKNITHGRSYGDGVYFAKDGSISMGSYAISGVTWAKSEIGVRSCVVLAEIVNRPKEFVCQSPFFVVSQTTWIICRYLLVNNSAPTSFSISTIQQDENGGRADIPFVELDPSHPLTLSQKRIAIPQPSYALEKLLAARNIEYVEEENDEEDALIFAASLQQPLDSAIEEDSQHLERPPDGNEWIHDPDWVSQTVQHLLPPPVEATPTATMALQKELKSMLREQERAKSISDLGWYMPLQFIGDNLFQWIVELHSFDESLPIAQDLVARKVNSLVFEIRFPPTFPHSPPFFRILKPRLLPFFQGGGGHVTGGGSMCMDLLTSDGWLPSYSISAVLLQIKLAISNLDPSPARLSPQWDIAYGIDEALQGYKRAAAAHGWRVPQGIDKLVR